MACEPLNPVVGMTLLVLASYGLSCIFFGLYDWIVKLVRERL